MGYRLYWAAALSLLVSFSAVGQDQATQPAFPSDNLKSGALIIPQQTPESLLQEPPLLEPVVAQPTEQMPVEKMPEQKSQAEIKRAEIEATEQAKAKAKAEQQAHDDFYVKLFAIYAALALAARLYLRRVVKKNLGCVFYSSAEKALHIAAAYGLLVTPWLFVKAMNMFSAEEWVWFSFLAAFTIASPILILYFWKTTIQYNGIIYGNFLFLLKMIYIPWSLLPSLILLVLSNMLSEDAQEKRRRGDYDGAALLYLGAGATSVASVLAAVEASKTLVNGELWEASRRDN